MPNWVAVLKGKFVTAGSIQIPFDDLKTVNVNGATFVKNGETDTWHPERGQHGTLEEKPRESFVFTSKDGTRYTYDYPSAKPKPVKTIEDRNGNTMTFTYDGDEMDRLTSVKDAAGREFTFTYKMVVPASERLTGIIGHARESAVRSVDLQRVLMYWSIGKRIFEEEQQGRKRAEYGGQLGTYFKISRDAEGDAPKILIPEK